MLYLISFNAPRTLFMDRGALVRFGLYFKLKTILAGIDVRFGKLNGSLWETMALMCFVVLEFMPPISVFKLF